MFYFKKRDGKFRAFSTKRKANGKFARRLDFGQDAPAGRRWAVQVFEGPVPAGATVAK